MYLYICIYYQKQVFLMWRMQTQPIQKVKVLLQLWILFKYVGKSRELSIQVIKNTI